MRHPPFLEPARASNQRQDDAFQAARLFLLHFERLQTAGAEKLSGGELGHGSHAAIEYTLPSLCGSEWALHRPCRSVRAPSRNRRTWWPRPHRPRCRLIVSVHPGFGRELAAGRDRAVHATDSLSDGALHFELRGA